jgi:hypothetical protein
LNRTPAARQSQPVESAMASTCAWACGPEVGGFGVAGFGGAATGVGAGAGAVVVVVVSTGGAVVVVVSSGTGGVAGSATSGVSRIRGGTGRSTTVSTGGVAGQSSAASVDAAAEAAFVPTCAARADRGPERRKTPRQALRAKASFRGEADVTAQRTVRIVNLSLKGVRFWSGQQMSSGDRGDVRMEAGPVKWASRVRVVSCVTQGEGYEVGCEFVANELGPRRANLVNPLVWAPTQGEPKAAEAKAA